MILYTKTITSRLEYIVHFLEQLIGVQITIIDKESDFINKPEPLCISYHEECIHPAAYHIKPQNLLFQKDINPQEITIGNVRGNKVLFYDELNPHGFDVFSAIFYLIVRYEEYLPHEKDIYGRYAHTNSIAYKKDFLQTPLVNFWVIDLVKQLLQHPLAHTEPALKEYINQLNAPNWNKFIPTYDIDIAYSYKHQSIIKNIGGFVKAIIKADIDKVIEQAKVFSGENEDPFDQYDWLDSLHKKYQLHPIYFFLVAAQKGQYDKNISPNKPAMRDLIKRHLAKYEVGVHPSWQSGDDKSLLTNEIDTFSQICNSNCTISRQHYIRISLPETYQQLIQNGIKTDASMGYGSINGFRASVASPYFWYDLKEEKETDLQLIPFCYMDANAIFEEHLSPQEALAQLQYFYSICKEVNGTFYTVFHNHFLTNQPEWIVWKDVYASFLASII